MTFVRIALSLLLAAVLPTQAYARDAAPATMQGIVAFASEEGMARLARSKAKADFAPLANQYEAQSNTMFCGPTTAAIVLNALRTGVSPLPRDHGRLQAGDKRYLSGMFDPVIPRYTQDNVLLKSPKTRAQVMGEPITINNRTAADFGLQLRQLDALFTANGARTRLRVVDAKQDEAVIRADLIENLQRAGDYVVVNYQRRAAGQQGGGHISPLAAYDAESDSFLMLDVNPAVYGWAWMPTANLVSGMRTFDTVENRGYLLVSP